ncbi:hypothetical protein IMZ48_20765 [Candidatus Bathyarchaeota archaeon]|nr:hypothetical protein [Candidatus Bathyarchaeota archaeon]
MHRPPDKITPLHLPTQLPNAAPTKQPTATASNPKAASVLGRRFRDGNMYNRDNRIMRKLLGRGATDTSTESPTGSSTVGITSAPNVAPTSTYRSSVPQNAAHRAGVPILCLDASPDRRMAVLAGRHILKTINIDGLSITDGVDVRAAILATAKGGGSSLPDQLSIKDVKWHGDSTIFTACSNGRIFSYDLASLGTGLDFVQMREDSRQVNTLDINPHRGSYLLSGSQDGLVRCFDIREPRTGYGGLTFRAVQSFKCNADGVRHVKWSPTDGLAFACGTESGVIMKWDLRKANSPLLRLAAHDKCCSSISWHPDGDHLMSAGWDSKCHVWNLSKTDKRQKAKCTISTPAPVASIAWRPGLWSATAQGKRVAQVAVSYDDNSQKRYDMNTVHVWDLARPTMPFKEIERFESPPASLLWKDQDILWTAGRDGLFNQCDVAFAPRVLDRQSLSSMAFSPRGDTVMFLDERPDALRPRPPPAQKPPGARPAPMLGASRSDSEEDVVGSFEGPRRKIQRPQHRRSSRSVPNASVTSSPPSAPTASDAHSLTLDQSLQVTGIFRTQQAMTFGHIPGAAKVDDYHYMAASYLEILQRELPSPDESGRPLIDRVARIMEKFARTAERARLFRQAQTWRVLAAMVNLLLVRRGQYHLEKRLGVAPEAPRIMPPKQKKVIAPSSLVDIAEEDTPKKRPSSRNLAPEHRNASVRSLLSLGIENTSNMPTPIAKPVEEVDGEDRDGADEGFVPGKRLTPVLEPESFTLGPAAHPGLANSPRNSPRKRLDSEPTSVESRGSGTEESFTGGYDFYDMEALSRAIDVPMSSAPEPRRLPGSPPQAPSSVRGLAREDSKDSYGFSTSGTTSTRISAAQSSLMGASGMKHHEVPVVPTKRDEESHAPSEASEYESRIRGQELEESPGKPQGKADVRHPESEDEMFLISQTTMGTEPYSQDSVPSQKSQLQHEPHQENGTHSNGNHSNGTHSTESREPTKPQPADPAPPLLSRSESQVVTETDYLLWPNDPPYPHPLSSEPSGHKGPLDPYTTISRALHYECRTSALHASAMILLLAPLVPDTVIDPFHATAILRQHHTRLMGMSLFVEAAHLRNLCVRGWPAGLPEWGADHASIFGPAQQNVKVAFVCTSCHRPREIDPRDKASLWRCERCRAQVAGCAVCGHREMGMDGELGTWWFCPACAHGGHAACLEAWHAEESGCCPFDGCVHACLPGRYRAEAGASRSEEVGRHVVVERRGSPGVRGDGNEVAQSRAVESVREALGREVGGMGGSPGRRERRKSVKFVGGGS